MGRGFFYCEFYVTVTRVLASRSSSGSFLDFLVKISSTYRSVLGENIINIPIVERRDSRSDHVVFEFGHEYVCNHRRQRVADTTPVNLFVQIPIEGEDRTLCNFLKESFKDALVGQMQQLVFIACRSGE